MNSRRSIQHALRASRRSSSSYRGQGRLRTGRTGGLASAAKFLRSFFQRGRPVGSRVSHPLKLLDGQLIAVLRRPCQASHCRGSAAVGGWVDGSADWHWRSEVYKYKDTNIPKDPSDMPSQPLHPQSSSRIARACRALLRRLGFSARWTRRDGYRPERHYMRGPGPKTRSLQSDCEQRPHTE
jgi:hypothetical protein